MIRVRSRVNGRWAPRLRVDLAGHMLEVFVYRGVVLAAGKRRGSWHWWDENSVGKTWVFHGLALAHGRTK